MKRDFSDHPKLHGGPSCPDRFSVGEVAGPVYETFWKFAAKRQDIYFKRLVGQDPPWTPDPILRTHRFTNAYRVLDRVTQYLISNVIYSGGHRPEDMIFRILLFKIFNKIETWELLESRLGEIAFSAYKYDKYERILSHALAKRRRLYSGAYIMPSPLGFGHRRKHQNHLRLLEVIMRSGFSKEVARAVSLREIFLALRSYPSFGDFLAFQYAIDINYSELTDFSESEFVVAGPGARRGLQKCFPSSADLNSEAVIAEVSERQQDEFERRGINFKDLWGRPLQLIDVQNLFCEVDKYSRVAHPKVTVPNERRRIKQTFRPASTSPGIPWFPPKWNLNASIYRTEESRFASDRGSRSE
jgi:hypothetical protein